MRITAPIIYQFSIKNWQKPSWYKLNPVATFIVTLIHTIHNRLGHTAHTSAGHGIRH